MLGIVCSWYCLFPTSFLVTQSWINPLMKTLFDDNLLTALGPGVWCCECNCGILYNTLLPSSAQDNNYPNHWHWVLIEPSPDVFIDRPKSKSPSSAPLKVKIRSKTQNGDQGWHKNARRIKCQVNTVGYIKNMHYVIEKLSCHPSDIILKAESVKIYAFFRTCVPSKRVSSQILANHPQNFQWLLLVQWTIIFRRKVFAQPGNKCI